MSEFIEALAVWQEKTPVQPRLWFENHWMHADGLCIFRYARKKQGSLPAAELLALNQLRISLWPSEEKQHSTKTPPVPGYALERSRNLLLHSGHVTGKETEHYARQLVLLTRAAISAVSAAHQLRDWNQAGEIPDSAFHSLVDCLQNYNAVWDLFSPLIRPTPRHPADHAFSDPVSAALDQLQAMYVRHAGGELQEWCNESTWLSVKHLLSWILGQSETVIPKSENALQMLLVSERMNLQAEDIANCQEGLTAPVVTACCREGFSAAYLDPVSLGVTILDNEMFTTLRIAARLCRPVLQTREPEQGVSLRISPQPSKSDVLVLTGGSAGGLVTTAALATAMGRRLNRNFSASFAVEFKEKALAVLNDRNLALRPEDIVLKPVSDRTILCKLTSESFQNQLVKTVYLHGAQQCRGSEWYRWVPKLERESNIRLIPVAASPPQNTATDQPVLLSLHDIVESMTGDERQERIWTEHLKAYLLAIIEDSQQLPIYFPAGATLDNIRVKMRIRTEVDRGDRLSQLNEESERRQLNDPERSLAYTHRNQQPEGEKEEEDELQTEIVDWDGAFRKKLTRVVVLADPGLGKTWLLKWEARQLAEAALSRLERAELRDLIHPIPIPLRLFDLGEAIQSEHRDGAPLSLERGLLRAIRRFRGFHDELTHYFERLIGDGKPTVLLLDAWDEAAAVHSVLQPALRKYVDSNPQSAIILTSRIVGQPGQIWSRFAGSDTDKTLELQHFGIHQQYELIQNFFCRDQKTATMVVEQLQAAPQIASLARIPLLLGFLCAYIDSQKHHRHGNNLHLSQLSRNTLHAFIATSLLQGLWHEEPGRTWAPHQEWQVHNDLALLSAAAFVLLRKGMQQFSRDALILELRIAHERQIGSPANSHTLQRLIEESGLFVRICRGVQATYMFLHLTVQEYLAAWHLIQTDEPTRHKLLGELWDHPAWKEVWDLVVLELNDAETLDEMSGAVFDNRHDVDEQICRPERQVLHWTIILGKNIPRGRCLRIDHATEWGVNALRQNGLLESLCLETIRRSSGFLPVAIQNQLVHRLHNAYAPDLSSVLTALAPHASAESIQTQLLLLWETGKNSRCVRAWRAFSPSAWPLSFLEKLLRFVYVPNLNIRGTQRSRESDVQQSASITKKAFGFGDDEPFARTLHERSLSALKMFANIAWLPPVFVRLRDLLDYSGLDPRKAKAIIEILAPHAGTENVQRLLLEMLDVFGWQGNVPALFGRRYVCQEWIGAKIAEALAPYAHRTAVQRRFVTLLEIDQWWIPDDHGNLSPGKVEEQRRIVEIVIRALAPYAGTHVIRDKLSALISSRNFLVYPTPLLNTSPVGERFVEMAREALIQHDCVDHLLARLKKKRSTVSSSVIKALGSHQEMEELLRPLFLEILEDHPKTDVSVAIIEVLARWSRFASVQRRLLSLLWDNSKDLQIRIAALCSLGPIAETEPVQGSLFKSLSHEDAAIRETAVRALGPHAAAEAVQNNLLKMLDDKDWRVRKAAVEALSPYVNSASVQARLISLLYEHESKDICRTRAVSSPRQSSTYLGKKQEYFFSTDEVDVRDAQARMAEVRETVAKALAPYSDLPIVQGHLVNLLTDFDDRVREVAIRALGRHLGIELVENQFLRLVDELSQVKSATQTSSLVVHCLENWIVHSRHGK